MKKEREIELKNLPDKDQYIIVSPEEIGMFFCKICMATAKVFVLGCN